MKYTMHYKANKQTFEAKLKSKTQNKAITEAQRLFIDNPIHSENIRLDTNTIAVIGGNYESLVITELL